MEGVNYRRIPRLVVAIFSLATLMAAQAIKSIEGQWAGTLQNSGGDTLPLTLSIARTANGELTGMLDSPKDGLYGLPLQGLNLTGVRVAEGEGTLYFEGSAGSYQLRR